MGALRAVIGRRADVAPLDSYALALMWRHAPQLTAQVRVVETTEATAIAALVASHPMPAIAEAFLAAGSDVAPAG
jgi:ABC-type phosphate/phosphonate transport system substrate-binding protein